MISIPRKQVSSFSNFSVKFSDQLYFSELIDTPFQRLNDLTSKANSREFSMESRENLHKTLTNQLFEVNEVQRKNIDLLLHENTFCVTTGHQLTLFAGPLYFIYKILHIIKLCNDYNQLNTDKTLVPVFWLASEDHDFEEVKAAQLFNKELSWNSTQSGAVGRYDTNGLEELKAELLHFFQGKEKELEAIFKLSNSLNYGQFMQQLVSKLFASYGLLVINPDDKNLKKTFLPIMKKELKERKSLGAVEIQNKKINALGFSAQAVAKEINLFYLSNDQRTRITFQNEIFSIGNEHFSEREILHKLEIEVENFSPNVILRPVYQELILPNLCYVGGGGEMAYWVQLKNVFRQFDVPFPLLQQRVSLGLIDKNMVKRKEKTPFDWPLFFLEKEELKKLFLSKKNGEEINFLLIDQAFHGLKNTILDKALQISQGLKSWSEAETVKLSKQLESVKQRLIKEVKSQAEVELQAIDFVIDRFLPKGQLQERFFHWLHFIPQGNIASFFNQLFQHIDPFNHELTLVILSEE